MIVHLFFCHRIWILGKSIIIPVFIMLVVTDVSHVMSIWMTSYLDIDFPCSVCNGVTLSIGAVTVVHQHLHS
jgi:hypothetical protein